MNFQNWETSYFASDENQEMMLMELIQFSNFILVLYHLSLYLCGTSGFV